MPNINDNDFEDLKNLVVTISAYDMGRIIAKVMYEICDSVDSNGAKTVSEQIICDKIIKLLGGFGANIMTEMFEDADTIEIE